MSSSSVPKLPLISASVNGATTPRSARGTVVSASQTRYTVATTKTAGDSEEPRTLTPRDLRAITNYISSNRTLQPQHRAGRLSDLIPPVPFQRIGHNADESLGLRLGKINPKESALDIPLRFGIPTEYRVPVINDQPMQAGTASSLGSRILTLLKGTSQVPQHSPEEREGTERDVSHCTILRDWELRAQVAKRGQQPRTHAVALLALGALHYRAANQEKSVRYLQEAAAGFEKCSDARGGALCHNLAGVALMHLNRHRDAMVHHRKQGALSGAYGRCVAQLNLGVCYGAVGELEHALHASKDAIGSAEEARDEVLETIAVGNVGIAYLRLGNLHDAQSSVEGCLERCSVAGDKVGAAVCLLLLSDMYCQLQDFPHSQFYGEHALRVATDAGCMDMADIARVTIGVARGAQSSHASMVENAKAMGMQVSAEQLIATLPRQ